MTNPKQTNFKKLERSGIVLQVNQEARLELVMELGATTETVEVVAQAALLDATNSAMGQVIDNRGIVNLPLNARTPFALVFLVPGTVGSVGIGFNQTNISINGGRPGSNEILADGIPSSPPLVNPIQGYSVLPSVDAVQEFKVQSNNYSAESDGAAAASSTWSSSREPTPCMGASSNSCGIRPPTPMTSSPTHAAFRWQASSRNQFGASFRKPCLHPANLQRAQQDVLLCHLRRTPAGSVH